MRPALVLAALLAATALAGWTPTAAAAEPFATDAAGDVQAIGFAGQGVPVDNTETGPADLVSLALVEDADNVAFVLGVKSVTATASRAQSMIEFGFGESRFTLGIYSYFAGGADYRSSLTRVTESEDEYEYEYIDDLDVAADTAANTLTVVVPKVYLLTEAGKVPKQGDEFEAIEVRSYGDIIGFGFGLLQDRMPDTGDAGDFELTVGPFANGHIVLGSDDPFRVSNGGSTTFVMVANVTNAAPIDDEVEIVIENLPEGWDVTHAKRQRLAPNGYATVTLLVSLPFEHQHGGVSEFNLTAKSLVKPGVYSSIRMGVLHTPIPQPAGHHDTLYLHSNTTASAGRTVNVGQDTGDLVMNTEMDAPDDVQEVAPDTSSCCDEDSGATWLARLNPGLAMGLDFDLEREGELVATFVPKAPGEYGALAELWLEREGGDDLLLAEGRADAIAGSANTPLTFTFPLAPEEEADYVPYAKGQTLALRLVMTTMQPIPVCCDEQISPLLRIDETSIKLPLNEYRDVVTTVEAATQRLALESADALEKKALAGSIMTYTFNVTNNGGDDVFIAEVAGSDAEMGGVVPDESFELKQGETRQVTLAVQVPYEAAADEQIEVLLLVRSQADPSNMAVARTYTTVTTGTDALPDETQKLRALQDAENDTPGVGIGLALGLLALVALALRRRG